jgi:hypothetical protein
MKKILIYSGIGIALITILYFVFKPKAKKDCGCQGGDPIAAINAMNTDELKEQITALGDKRRLEGLSDDELKAILIELVQK